MSRYVALLRGVNVGGRNSVPMARLRTVLGELGFTSVATYIASGNVILESTWSSDDTRRMIETALPRAFALDVELVKVLVLSAGALQAVVDHRPDGFGAQPDRYHSDVIFLIDMEASEAIRHFDPRPGVDAVWPGDGVIYSQRLSAERTRSRLAKVIGTPVYQSMTIRNWTTTTTLLDMVARGGQAGRSRSR